MVKTTGMTVFKYGEKVKVIDNGFYHGATGVVVGFVTGLTQLPKYTIKMDLEENTRIEIGQKRIEKTKKW